MPCVIDSAEGRAKLGQFGAVPVRGTPEALRARMKADAAKWKKVFEGANIKFN